MKNSNWMVTDVINKKSDVVGYIKSVTVKLSEERILKIAEISQLNRSGLINVWSKIPSEFKNVSNNCLGTA